MSSVADRHRPAVEPEQFECVFVHQPPRLAVTGGIGGGKSTALAYLRELGAATLSSDAVVHEVYSRPEVIAAVKGRFGEQVLAGGAVNRTALANVVFQDGEALQWLEQFTHPLVRARIEEWAQQCQSLRPAPELLAVEVPLYFESGTMIDLFDCVLLVTAPAEVRRRRLTAKLTPDEFDRRSGYQMPEAQKTERSHFVVENTGSRADMRREIAEVVASIISNARGEGGSRSQEPRRSPGEGPASAHPAPGDAAS